MKRRFCLAALLVVGVALLFSACSGAGDEPSPSPSPESSPSDSFFSPSPTASSTPQPTTGIDTAFWSRIDGSTATIPLSEAVVTERENLEPGTAYQYIEHNTTHNAYVNLLDKKADLIFVTYPSEEELSMAEARKMELTIVPVVKDAFVFLVNAENPVKSVTFDQVRSIYTGGVTSWKTLGGSDLDIIPFQRPENSGSQTLFLKLVMDGLTPMEPPVEWLPSEMNDLVDVVSSYDNGPAAIGYSVFYYVSDMYGSDRFRLLGIDGVVPTRDSIARGDYRLETFYYAVFRADTPEDSPVRALVDWLVTDEGQRVAQDAGYVPLRELP